MKQLDRIFRHGYLRVFKWITVNEFELHQSLLTSLFRMNEMLKKENCNLFCHALGNIARIS